MSDKDTERVTGKIVTETDKALLFDDGEGERRLC